VLRPARFVDVPAMVDILVEKQPMSRYAEIDTIDTDYARKMLAQCVQRHGGDKAGATCANVIERDGEIVAFMVGQLDRLYGLGHLLSAHDLLLVARNGTMSCGRRLMKAYIDWAFAIPKVVEVFATHSDILPSTKKSRLLFSQLGFTESGKAYRMTRNPT